MCPYVSRQIKYIDLIMPKNSNTYIWGWSYRLFQKWIRKKQSFNFFALFPNNCNFLKNFSALWKVATFWRLSGMKTITNREWVHCTEEPLTKQQQSFKCHWMLKNWSLQLLQIIFHKGSNIFQKKCRKKKWIWFSSQVFLKVE